MAEGPRSQHLNDAALRHELAEALTPSSPLSADVVRDPDATLEIYPLSVLRRFAIYRVSYLGPYHAAVFYLGYTHGGPLFWLTGHPSAFMDMAQADGVVLSDAPKAAEYAGAFLETAHDRTELFYILASVDDIAFLPSPRDDEHARIAACRAQYGGVVRPPSVCSAGPPFTVTLYAMREQALERHTLTVQQNGALDDAIDVIATGLPTVYSR